jgi:PKD repeat protein
MHALRRNRVKEEKTMNLKVVKLATIVILVTLTISAYALSTGGCSGIPPSASFTYWPSKPCLNMTVNFDASASSPESYNGTITKYEWSFGDGTSKVIKTGSPADPTVTHVFGQIATFVVTLNVTDDEGLWCTTSKPITILPEFGPTANFTWTPQPLGYNQPGTFDASGSTLGWSAKSQRFSPIQNCTWNFGDGTGNIVVTSLTLTHTFTTAGNYTVQLKVTDADGRSAQTSALVQVSTAKPYDVNGDGIINLKDVYEVALAFGSSPGYPNWNPLCDFNQDGVVNLKDYYPVCVHYGEDP